MRKLVGLFVAVAMTGCYATVAEDGRGSGGGGAYLSLNLPRELPPLVVVEPGVSVVGDFDDEVFFVDGYYWVRQDRSWYRTRDHRGGWGRMDARQVPRSIVQYPPGRYRHYRGDRRDGHHQRGDSGHGQEGRGHFKS
jgi:hypothetical protein